MKSVVKFTIKQAVFLNVVFVILILVGAFSILTIPVENMPTVDMGKVFIQTTYYGASADDVEQLVTTKIEITTITTAIGLLPMAIGIPTRSISWAPMATAF